MALVQKWKVLPATGGWFPSITLTPDGHGHYPQIFFSPDKKTFGCSETDGRWVSWVRDLDVLEATCRLHAECGEMPPPELMAAFLEMLKKDYGYDPNRN